ncbi:hypothetical protein [Streptomyces sp. NPDC051546]|uniref:hypothetical protein n=1 Tax=Streptomyces sp. NPDC051546 TaxID=3365655 RepID=UPI0037996F59
MIIRNAPAAAPPSPRRLLYSIPAMVMGVAAILTGVWLLLVPVPQDRADARAYDAATSCVAGSARERAGDCLSAVPAVLDKVRSEGRRNRRVYLEVRREDGGPQEIRVPGSTSATFAPAGTALQLVSWRGEIRHVNYGTGKAARTVFTEHNPRTAHRTPLGWALGLGPAGAALLWGGAWFAWFPSRSWRTTPCSSTCRSWGCSSWPSSPHCRDVDTEILIAVERRAMPWLVGALTAPGSA